MPDAFFVGLIIGAVIVLIASAIYWWFYLRKHYKGAWLIVRGKAYKIIDHTATTITVDHPIDAETGDLFIIKE